MTAFEDFTLYVADTIAANKSSQGILTISNDTTELKLIYCIPRQFTKRQTDTSNAQAQDKTSPDTGTAKAGVELRFEQERKTTLSTTTDVLAILLKMFYTIASTDVFRKARFGLISKDNPQLDVNPTAQAGYKFIDFQQEPNPDNPAIRIFTVQLEFIGDHTQLRAFGKTPT